MISFDAELNPQQLAAVRIDTGPILILAGAGSGKTRVITYRIAYLIKVRHVPPDRILAVTFTNKAADEMKHRVAQLLDARDQDVWIRTFHATCAKILRGAAPEIDRTRSYTIYDESDQVSLMKACLREANLDPRELKPEYVLELVSHAKENLQTPDHFRPRAPEHLVPALRRLYATYERKLAENNALDFDDLICKTVFLFQQNPAIREYYQRRFRYVLVDEFQDTNRAQYVLTSILAEQHQNLCVVGDDDQSIYSWRGAEIKNILEFEQDYPAARIIKLEQNYRSTKTILKAASHVVRNNQYRKSKTLWCDNEPGERIEYYEARDDHEEAAFVARRALDARAHAPTSEVAVFYRLNYQSRVFEDAFVRYGLPYQVIGALRFYERVEIKNILAYLRAVNNPNDTVSLLRIINVPPRGIGAETVGRLTAAAREQGCSLYQILGSAGAVRDLTARAQQAVLAFRKQLDAYVAQRTSLSLYELALRVARESGYLESLTRRQTEEEFNRRKNVEELLISVNEYVQANPQASLDDYLESVSLQGDTDELGNARAKVFLMTLHNAKGLEFDHVFITGLEDGLIPHYKSEEEGRFEEERRLLYVGITRAKRRLVISCSRQRSTYRGGVLYSRPSPFLKEIPDEVFATCYV